MQQIRPRCFFIALVFGWVAAVYLPAAIIAASGLSPLAAGRSLPGAIWAVADETAPAAKLGFALAFALLLFARRRLLASFTLAADMAAGGAAMLLVLALLPQYWSRGFGIGLGGTRFDPTLLAIYLASGALAGLGFSLSEAGCGKRATPAA
jgi:hypothetical protein